MRYDTIRHEVDYAAPGTKAQPTASFEARLLAERLAEARPGEVQTYEEYEALIGREIRKKRRDLLDTARKIVLREHGLVFRAVTGIGLQCLTSTGIVAVGEDSRKRLNRKAKRTVQELGCATLDDLTAPEVHRLLAYTSILGAVSALTYFATTQKAQQIIAHGDIPVALNIEHIKHLF